MRVVLSRFYTPIHALIRAGEKVGDIDVCR